jgi:hypothetical protein
MENPEINICPYSQSIFDEGAKNIHWRKDSVFNKWCWQNWTSIHRRMKVDPLSITQKSQKTD